jgi:uncharacterized membrane protein YgdD (TMEM256/DUF423 family)
MFYLYPMQTRNILMLAAALGMIAVIFGAFSAHALKARLDVTSLGNWETATRYQFYHVFAMIASVYIAQKTSDSLAIKAAWLFFTGILLFSGSLYLLSTRSLIGANLSWLGPVTPLGGLSFICGWICLLVVFQRSVKN